MIGELISMLPNDMNLPTGKIKNYNNKILVSSSCFNIGTNLKINLDGEKVKPYAKSKRERTIRTKPDIESNKEHKEDVKVIRTKPDIKFKKEDKIKADTNKITYEEGKVALILGMTSLQYGGYLSD